MESIQSRRLQTAMHSITNTTAAFLTTRELQDRLKISHMTIARLRKSGKLRAYRFGVRGVRFAMSDVIKFEAESAA